MKDSGIKYVAARNKACHYGPKLDVLMKKYNEKPEIIITIQLDFILSELFDVYFLNKKGEKERPVVIHRALPFSLERTIGFLMEYYQGDMPFWLVPKQIVFIPMDKDENIQIKAKTLNDTFSDSGLRSSIDSADIPYNKRVKNAIKQNVGYIALVGKDELGKDKLTLRDRAGKIRKMKGNIALEELSTLNKNRK
jgi:threonyl-tRNA synthetase